MASKTGWSLLVLALLGWLKDNSDPCQDDYALAGPSEGDS